MLLASAQQHIRHPRLIPSCLRRAIPPSGLQPEVELAGQRRCVTQCLQSSCSGTVATARKIGLSLNVTYISLISDMLSVEPIKLGHSADRHSWLPVRDQPQARQRTNVSMTRDLRRLQWACSGPKPHSHGADAEVPGFRPACQAMPLLRAVKKPSALQSEESNLVTKKHRRRSPDQAASGRSSS
jgi:hypothetical protein